MFSSSEDELSLLLVSRGVGLFGGWVIIFLLNGYNFGLHNEVFNMGLFGLSMSCLILTRVMHLWWAMVGFFMQGIFVFFLFYGMDLIMYKVNFVIFCNLTMQFHNIFLTKNVY